MLDPKKSYLTFSENSELAFNPDIFSGRQTASASYPFPSGYRPNISAFLPAYNEGTNLPEVIYRLTEVLERVAGSYEIIVVNDGSTDATATIVAELRRDNPRLKLINHSKNLGYGAAVNTGFQAATLDWIFFTDSDGQFDVTEIQRLLPLMPHFDIIAGYRIQRADPLFRKFNAWAWGTLVKNLFGLKNVRDIDCAFKIVRRELFEHFTLQSSGALISTELLVKAQKNGFKIAEIGVHHFPRKTGKQTGAKIAVIANAFRELFGYYWLWERKGYR